VLSDFSEELCRLMAERDLGVREIARLVPCNAGFISNLRYGRKRPSAEVALRLDQVLEAGGYLARLADNDSALLERGVARRPTGRTDGPSWHERPAASPGGRAWALPAGQAGSGLPVEVGELVMAAAHESADRAARDAGRTVPDLSISQLRQEVWRLARGYGDVPPLPFLAESRSMRDLAFWMAERTSRPRQSTELYVALGQICALMSVASFDLAVWPAAVEQSHAAKVYAEIAGYSSLQAWAIGMQALTAYWCGRAHEAAALAQAGLALAPQGTARARLHSIAARARSHLGAEDGTRAALALADREREYVGDSGDDELHDVIGGQFGWAPARQAMSSASALLQIGDAGGAAERAREAIRLCPPDRAGSFVGMRARADLACAELAHGQLDAAIDALEPVWELSPEFRRNSLVERLTNVAGALAAPTYSGTAIATALADRIEAFSAESAPRSLPRGTDAT
jgi:hypothetical protein